MYGSDVDKDPLKIILDGEAYETADAPRKKLFKENEEEEDDCEDDDYCSDTSTSSPNNTRVCDCCYCEVFGHNTPPVAPTSRNYHEMRERLRSRLDKRRAERCERNASSGNKDKEDEADTDSAPVDQRNLDDILKFINGTGQKDKKRGSNRSSSNTTTDTTNKNNNNNNSQNKKGGSCRSSKEQPSKNQNIPTKSITRESNKSNSHHHLTSPPPPQPPSSLPLSHNQLPEHHHRTTNVAANTTQNISAKPALQASTLISSSCQKRHDHGSSRERRKETNSCCTESAKGSNNITPDDVFMPRDIDLNCDDLDEIERELEAFKRFCFDSTPLVKKERVRVELKNTSFLQELTQRFANCSSGISDDEQKGHRHSSNTTGKQPTGTSIQEQVFRRKASRV